jgi:hypothetical protein
MPRIHPNHFHRNRKIEHFVDRVCDPCLQCGSRIIRTGRRFALHCVEGRVVPFRICRACAQLPVAQVTSDSMIRRAA